MPAGIEKVVSYQLSAVSKGVLTVWRYIIQFLHVIPYTIEAQYLLMYVIKVGHRKDVYRKIM